MNECVKCMTVNPPGACFCMSCGATLGATAAGGTTVVLGGSLAPPTTPRVPPPLSAAAVPSASSSWSDQLEVTLLVNDVSGSMDGYYDGASRKIDAAIGAAVGLVISKGRIDPHDEIGLVAFNSQARLILGLCPIGAHRQQIISAIQSLTPGNGTDINEGLKAADASFVWHRTGVVRRIVLLTDGVGGDPLATAESLKARGVIIDVIGVGDSPANVDEKLLRRVASTVQGELRYRFIKDHPALLQHYTTIAGKTKVA